MPTDGYGIQDIKKELQHLSAPQLTELVLKLVRYKKENKELAAYLLFVADDEVAFIEGSKHELVMLFYGMPSQPYNAAKALRKILRLITKLSRFSGSKTVEISLLIAFCNNYLEFVDKRNGFKPLRNILIKQIEKIGKLITKLHEDVQGDFTDAYNQLIDAADEKLSWFNKLEHLL